MSRTPDSDLHALIASLSQAERRYVKQELRRHVLGEVNQSELLFDAIAAQSEYNEARIKQRFEGRGFVQRLPEAKRELLTVILRAMRQFHAGRTAQREALTAYLDGVFLLGRGLARLGDRRMRAAVEASALTENHALRLLATHGLMQAERSSVLAVEPTSAYEQDPIVIEAQRALEAARLQALEQRMQALVERYGQSSNPAALAIARDLVRQASALQPFATLTAHHSWLRLRSLNALFFDVDRLGALDLDKERLAIIESNESFRRANLSMWLNLLHSVALRLCVLGRPAEAIPYRETLRAYWSGEEAPLTPGVRANVLGQYLNLEIFLAASQLDLASVQPILSGLLALIEQHESDGPTEIGIAAWFNLGLLAFADGRYRDAIRWLQRVDEYPASMRADVHRAAAYLLILCHVEQDHESVVQSMVRRQRRLLKGTVFDPAEEEFLSLMARYFGVAPGSARQKLFRTTLERLENIDRPSNAQPPTEMFGFTAWLIAKRDRRRFRQVALSTAIDQ